MTTLPALIEKLRGLKGPDREMDAEIWAEFDFANETREMDRNWSALVPSYTDSLDAVIDLIEREMPGAAYVLNSFDVQRKPERVRCNKAFLSDYAEPGHSGKSGEGATPALALLLAFLTAKMEMKDG